MSGTDEKKSFGEYIRKKRLEAGIGCGPQAI